MDTIIYIFGVLALMSFGLPLLYTAIMISPVETAEKLKKHNDDRAA